MRKEYPDLCCKNCGKKLTRAQIRKSLNRSSSWRLPKYCCSKCSNAVNSKLPVTQETRDKMSKSLRALGRHISEEHKKAVSKTQKGKTISEEHKKAISKAHKGIPRSEEVKQKISKSNKGKNSSPRGPLTKDHRKKLRLARIKYLERIIPGLSPAYNVDSCKWFKRFNFENNTNGQYATNGGEFRIPELGYWLDYINFDLKLIIEWDEERHYKRPQRYKDKERQEEIEELYSEFHFIRIREKYIDSYPLSYLNLLQELTTCLE